MSETVSKLFPAVSPAKIPVSVLTGFLGSGKTTLLNDLLRSEEMSGTAVIINEFGEVPLDGALLGNQAGEVVTLANGCLCCVVGDDFEAAMGNLYRSVDGANVRRIVIETSGLADPAPIIGTLLNSPLMASWCVLDSVITTVDAANALTQLKEHPEAVNQIAFADRLIVTKVDLVPQSNLAEVTAAIEGHNRHGRVVVSDGSGVSPAQLFGVQSRDGKANAAHIDEVMRQIDAHDHAHHAGGLIDHHHHTPHVQAFAISEPAGLDWSRFNRWFRTIRIAHGDDLLRMKGILHVTGEDKPVVVHAVRHIFHSPSALESWKGLERSSRLVFIVRGEKLKDLIIESFAREVSEKGAAVA